MRDPRSNAIAHARSAVPQRSKASTSALAPPQSKTTLCSSPLPNSLNSVHNRKQQERRAARERNNAHGDTASDKPSTEHGNRRARPMAKHRAGRDEPVVLASGHRNGGDLRAVAPLAEERHGEGLHPRGRQQQRSEVLGAAQQAGGAAAVGRRRWRRRAHAAPAAPRPPHPQPRPQRVRTPGRPPPRRVPPQPVLRLRQLRLHLFHLVGDAVVRVHARAVAQEFETEDEEEQRGRRVRQPLRHEVRHRVAEDR